ncbi:DUF255 domain-containing protein [Simiduia curdlanivorans]|uniref:Thioredoxin domain-containing protein n=1 Tax=Simiduia curdlanivorans TaxID=1492769 RepID=A0ABV8V6T2_9GAMM|nr:DUF255 domain-containing protein [Simiduia curdlanivorans]MDN3640819.1 DUF255 domain-containing protein [Simiduia curdlanivorans]
MTLRNQLSGRENRYLLQHAGDPVAWQLWSPEALALARAQDKPIFLSIGYSACNSCQVMQSESFSDPSIAAHMNDHFINIKVDKEERPDLDDIFQTAHQLLNGQTGGWPLSVFLCPKTLLPFVVGTYFPREPSDGRIPFGDLLIRVVDFYRGQPKDFLNLREQMGKSFKALNELPDADDAEYADLYLLHEASVRLLAQADKEHGGFLGAPKFTLPFSLWRLLEAVSENTELVGDASAHLTLSLDRIGGSAIHDSIEGGFFRYAIDAAWRQPQFEKMLFDNAALLGLYSAASTILKQPMYAYVARKTQQWLDRCLAVDQGFGASLDARTGGGDGTSYYFTKAEIKAQLSGAEYAFFNVLYGLERQTEAPFLLHCVKSPAAAAERLGMDLQAAEALFESACESLRLCRAKKPQPARDDKVIGSWNSLLAKSLAQMARYLNDPEANAAAQQLIDKLVDQLWYNKRLFSLAYKNGDRLPAFLDDYAFLLLALLDMLRVEWRDSDYRIARYLAEGLLTHFYDQVQGGFYFTAHDQEELPYRPKPYADTMTPSGNGAAALALFRFGYLTAEPRYVAAAQHTIKHVMPLLRRQPEAHYTLLQAMRESLLPKPVVLLLGEQLMADWQQKLLLRYQDQIYCYRVPTESELHPLEVMVMEENTALICRADQADEEAHETYEALVLALDQVLSPELALEKFA